MCVELVFGSDSVSVKNEFKPKGRVLIQDDDGSFYTNKAHEVRNEVYWDGWIQQEQVANWIARGAWKRAEIFATKFNQRGRIYDVPPGQVIKGIAFRTSERTILKVVTREAVGKETEVQARFALTGQRRLIPGS